MDASLRLRLDSSSPFFDSELYGKLCKVSRDYISNGIQTLAYYLPDYDSAYDLANALAALPDGTTAAQFEKIERSGTRNFSHPAGATQVTVLATAISQILFGGETNRRVEARNPDDETRADATNQLLAWNDQQNNSYGDGYLWVLDSIICNRGVWYDHWQNQYESKKEPHEYELPYVPKKLANGRWTKQPDNWKPTTATRWRTVQEKVGGYTKLELISPYDFICDPEMPLMRFQESRYAGHRVLYSWQELKRRSELDPGEYDYVLPETVKRLKNKKNRKGFSTFAAQSNAISTSRSYFDRTRRTQSAPDLLLTNKVNAEDGGTVECWTITIRLRPKTYGIYEDDTDELIEFLMGGENELLSVNVLTNEHAQFPYAIGEARPTGHMQYSPSWALLMTPTQNYIDVLKGSHAEQVERCGSMFLGDGEKCDIENVLLDKTRVRQLILKTEQAGQTPNDQILEQIPMTDPTKDFLGEIQFWEAVLEKTSGATPPVQGQTEDPSQTLGQYQDVQQMAMGRLSTIARNLSSRALVPQTRRIVMNSQQFMPDEQTVRIVGTNGQDYDPDEPPQKFMTIRREPYSEEEKAAMIQEKAIADQEAISRGEIPSTDQPWDKPDIAFAFDVTPSDGAMPGVDARAVAAATRLIEAAANPAFQNCFNNVVPGNLDPKAILVYVAEKSGLPMQNFLITRETAQKNLQSQLAAQGIPQPGQPGAQGPTPPIDPATGQPSAAVLPPNPTAAPPQATGAVLPAPQL